MYVSLAFVCDSTQQTCICVYKWFCWENGYMTLVLFYENHIAWCININIREQERVKERKKKRIKLFGEADIMRQKLVSVLKQLPFYSIYIVKVRILLIRHTNEMREKIKQKEKPEKKTWSIFFLLLFATKNFFILHVRRFFSFLRFKRAAHSLDQENV